MVTIEANMITNSFFLCMIICKLLFYLCLGFLVFEIFQELALLYHVYWVNVYGHVTSLDTAHYLVISNPQWYKTTVERGNYWCINVKKNSFYYVM